MPDVSLSDTGDVDVRDRPHTHFAVAEDVVGLAAVVAGDGDVAGAPRRRPFGNSQRIPPDREPVRRLSATDNAGLIPFFSLWTLCALCWLIEAGGLADATPPTATQLAIPNPDNVNSPNLFRMGISYPVHSRQNVRSQARERCRR